MFLHFQLKDADLELFRNFWKIKIAGIVNFASGLFKL